MKGSSKVMERSLETPKGGGKDYDKIWCISIKTESGTVVAVLKGSGCARGLGGGFLRDPSGMPSVAMTLFGDFCGEEDVWLEQGTLALASKRSSRPGVGSGGEANRLRRGQARRKLELAVGSGVADSVALKRMAPCVATWESCGSYRGQTYVIVRERREKQFEMVADDGTWDMGQVHFSVG